MPTWLDLTIAGVLLCSGIYLLATPKRHQLGDEAEEWLRHR
jgi:hypothetical protein